MDHLALQRSLKKVFKKLLNHQGVLYGLVFGLIGGVVLLFGSYAATPSTSVEPEQGTVSSPAQVVTDNNASGGQAVKFTTAQTGGTVTLPNPGVWTNITGNMANLPASCGDFGGIWPVPGSAALIAGVGQQNLYKSASGNSSWSQLGSGAGSAQVANRVGNIVYDPNNANIFYEGGIYGGGGVFKTTDGGITFTQLGNINHNDSVAVDFSDPNRRTLLAGGHEQSQTLYRSTDGGNNWTNIGGNLPAGTGFSSGPFIINSSTYFINTYPSWGGGTPGIYRTTNGGASWTKVSSEAANQPPLILSNGTVYYSDGNGLVKSSDQGVTWATVGSNLKFEFRPNILTDGRLVSIDNSNRLVVSADGGNTWTEFGAALPYNDAAGIAYSQSNQALYIWHWSCNFTDPRVLTDAAYQIK